MREFLAKNSKNIKKNWQLIAICFSITALSFLVLLNHFRSQFVSIEGKSDPVYIIESNILDFKLKQRGTDTSKTNVGILAIDERSLTKFGRWPFSRKYYSRAFSNLKKLGVKWIGFDVIWAEPEKTLLEDSRNLYKKINSRNHKAKIRELDRLSKVSPSDLNFARAISEFQNIVLGYFFFGTENEYKTNAAHRKRYQGLDLMMESEISAIDFPEGKNIDDYFLPKAYGLVPNTDLYNASTSHFAFFTNNADSDAINRWVTLLAKVNGHLMPSLSLKVAAEYLNYEVFVFFSDDSIEGITLVSRDNEEDAIEIPIDPMGYGRLLVNHRGPAKGFDHFSLADAYDNTFSKEEREKLKGSVLLLGATATGINDLRPNPFDPAIDGVENHAAAIDNILRQNFLRRPAIMFGQELAIVLGIGLFFSPILIWGRAISSGIAVLLFLAGFLIFDHYYWFANGIWTYLAVPCSQILLMFLSTNVFKYITEEKDKKFLKEAFGSYISPELIEDMYDSGEPPKLGGHSGILTAFFTDIQSFSSFSEQLSATQLVELLNEYLTAMTDILLEEKGTLDKYEGDAIIAFFGAPMKLEDHAIRACSVAVRMQDTLLLLRQKWTNEGDKWPEIVKQMRMRIGVNSGDIVTGNMGSRDRMNYTMMGDSVNLAARLEEAAKQYGIFSHVSQYTKELTGDAFIMRELDTIRVVGKKEPVTTYELLGYKGRTPQGLMMLQESFHKGLALYKGMQWDAAIEKFQESLELEYQRFPEFKGKKTNPSEIYIERCEEFKKNPPPADWDRVYTLTKK